MSRTDDTPLDSFLNPLRLAIESEYARKRLFGDIGWDIDALPQARIVEALETIESATTTLGGFVDDPPDTLAEFGDALDAAGQLVDGFHALDDAVSDTTDVDPEIYAALGEDLFTRLVVLYLRSDHPVLLQVAVFLTLVRSADAATRPTLQLDDGTVVRYASPALDFDLEHLTDLLADPIETLAAEYGLDEEPDQNELQASLAERLLPVLTALLHATGARVSYGTEADEVTTPFSGLGEQLGWIRVAYGIGSVDFTVRVHVFADTDGDVALAVVPGGEAVVNHRLGGWVFTLTTAGSSSALAIDTADGSVIFETRATERLDVTLRAVKLPDGDSENTFVVGGSEGTRLEIGRLGVEGSASLAADQEYSLLARASDSTFALSTSDVDGFVSQVFPEGMAADFDLGLGWSTQRGVHLEGSGSLELTLPMHLSLGELLSLDGLSISVSADAAAGRIPVYVATSASAQLGPVSAVVERIGLEAELSFPDDGGNLGPVDVDLGFKPPNGVGLSVDASAVVGGGYLYFDHDQQRYAGALSLQIGSLTLDAIGLLTTRLPDGSDGFSLLVIITGEFPPVQLGFGFTLNAVGGLLGVNRGVRVDSLRAGVRDNSVRSVLFPEDPVRNAPTLVSDLRQFFPPTRSQHVFGPMAELGWGTPTIVRAQLGLLLELPSPVRLLILGRVQAALPEPEAALLLLQMNALGVVNFDEGTAAIDASLYDSRVVTYTLTGDMAMRARWGDDPDFGLAVGGFHPRFDPPPEFPDLRRVAVALAAGNNPRLRMEGYFALTSNTVQVGAAVDAYASAAGFSVSGHLGFDALFQFDPFKFLVDFAARVRVSGHGLSLGLGLNGSLEGPSPWHLRGKAYIDLFLFSATVKVNATIGEAASSPGIPPANVFDEFRAALAEPGNWSAQLPAGGDSLVTLREVDAAETELLAHPLGQLSVVQRVVPMDVAIERYGNAEPADYHTFRIGEVTVDEQPTAGLAGRELDAQFAPAQFFDLTDSEKLSRPSFERFPAGYSVTNGLLAYGGRPDSEADPLGPEVAEQTLSYESVYVDEEEEPQPFFAFVDAATVAAVSLHSAVARSEARTTGPGKFANADTAPISVADTAYTVVTEGEFDHVAETGVPAEGTTYTRARQACDAHRTANSDADVQVVAAHELETVSGGPT